MKKGYDYLAISFIAIVITGYVAKIGAGALDKLLFILIAYGLGSVLAFAGYVPNMKKLDKKVRKISIMSGVVLGIVNFSAFFTALSALASGPGAIIFPMLGLNVAFIVVLSIVLFKERLNVRGIIGFILALVAILLLR